MKTQALAKVGEGMPTVFDDFFKPWNEWFDGGLLRRAISVPAVNIIEKKDKYLVSLAAPGMKKNDFNIDLDGNMLTISCEKEDRKEEENAKFTRKEYNYSSFSRSFSLPEEVDEDKIDAKYEDGVLNITLPRKENGRGQTTKKIAVK